MTATAFWTSPGTWIAAAGGVLMLVNTVRALTAPAPFATYLGLPLADARDAGLVKVYGLRALFIALVLAILLIRRDAITLGLVSIAATVMPIGDALLTRAAGAPRGTVVRHIVIAIALALAGALLVLR